MEKVYILENLCCANCAAKIEAKLNDLPEVEKAVIVFPTRQLRLTAKNPDSLLPKMEQLARSVEPDVTIRSDKAAPQKEEKTYDLPEILIGAGFFLAGLVTGKLLPQLPIALILYVAGWLVLGRKVLMAAVTNLFRGHVLDENFLMSLATIGAFFIGEYPEAVGVMLFYRVGEYLEHRAVARSRSRIMEAVDLRPETVHLASGKDVPAESVRPGTLVVVRPGDRIPLDGRVVAGRSRIDTSPITGEPVPVSVGPGDAVTSGCVNTGSLLTVRTEKALSESMVTRILNTVENAAAGKPKIDRFITRFARIYTPVVVAVAVTVAVVPPLFLGNWHYWVYTALSFLVMSCPCALVLSIPLSFFCGIGAGGKQGILFKDGLTMEALAEIKAVALDKTGTITKGDFSVTRVSGSEEMLFLCACAECRSSHPVAVSITQYAKQQGIRSTDPEKLEELPGHGVRAWVKGQEILCGNEKLMQRFGITVPEQSGEKGTRVLVSVDGSYVGFVEISDAVKEGAVEAVSRLRHSGVAVAMITGDGEAAARNVASQVGIDRVYAGQLPEQKLQTLQSLRTEHNSVMFVGDGINDAPVLAGADVGGAMGTGTDAAIEAADVVFLTSDVEAIPEAVEIARQTKRISRQNVVLALGIKGVVMLLGLLGYASLWAAVFADSGVALLCVANAVRLLYKKRKNACEPNSPQL
ncbi:MAG: cadmium-translocating P-type ATPase [Oscillospiraceae bacterium]|nr:cadmium-translocating P-type ATPase [Oscillospiraceae bacterium]